MKLRRLRDGDSVDGSTLLVRGGELDPQTLRADATRYFTVYGCYGISVFALRGLSLDELAQQVPLVRFSRLTVIRAQRIIEAKLRLEPTGRNPDHFTVSFDDLEEGIKALTGCDSQVTANPYFGA